MDYAREELQRLIDERREDYASLSRLLGRNAAYIQQFMKRGTPKKLPEDERRVLARYFGVHEEKLGGPPPEPLAEGRLVAVPRLLLGASAGPGAIADDEQARQHFAFDPKWLRTVATNPQRLSIICVAGDSMLPNLADGDDILVEAIDGRDRLRDGIFVLRMDDALVVKRLTFNPSGKRVSISSDNPAYRSFPDRSIKSVDIVGRVGA
jgi:hypothetical protein